MNNKHCINCKYGKKAMIEKPCCDCRGRHSNYKLWEDENGGKEKMKRSKKISLIGIKDAIDYIMWNRKELLDEIKLTWAVGIRYEMRLIMSRNTLDMIRVLKNPSNIPFDWKSMTFMDIPVVFDNEIETNFIILEVEEKEKPCVLSYTFCDEFILSRDRLNSIYRIPTDLRLKIKEVIYNPPATIIKWMDGTKTVVKCQDGEIFDKEKGFAMAFLKKALGNEGKYYDTVKKWVPMEEEQKKAPVKVTKFVSVKEFAGISGMAESTVRHHCINGRIKGAVKNEEGFWRIPIDVYSEGTLIEHLQGNSDELTGYPI